MSKTKLKIENLYKIFGPRGKSFIDPVKNGMSKQELLDNHSHVLGLNNINIDKENRTALRQIDPSELLTGILNQ